MPTPLIDNREPDLTYVESAAESLSRYLRSGQLVDAGVDDVPGHDARACCSRSWSARGLECGEDFHLALSPERIDPGRTDYTVRTTPKVVGGITPACTERAAAVYAPAIDTIVRVSSPEAAELTKLLENIFRSVNIALDERDGDALRPHGHRRLGGRRRGGHQAVRVHELQARPRASAGTACPLDPFYLAWKAREYDFYTEFIELAGKVNENMPYFCMAKHRARR